jgi:O-acetyl-ADP-ribose deacetylase (regulator of RNase III)
VKIVIPLEIFRNDITKMKVDAIVTATNTSLEMGGGVCGAIFRAAGAGELQEACDQIGGCKGGEAFITDGFQLDAKFIIHTPGPIWQGGGNQEEALLKGTAHELLELANTVQAQPVYLVIPSTFFCIHL